MLAIEVAHETALTTSSKVTELDGIKICSYIPLDNAFKYCRHLRCGGARLQH